MCIIINQKTTPYIIFVFFQYHHLDHNYLVMSHKHLMQTIIIESV